MENQLTTTHVAIIPVINPAIKAIKIEDKNALKIEALLRKVNGKSTAHTFNKFEEIKVLVDSAEKRLESVLGGKSHFADAQVLATSGKELPNAYKYLRVTTEVMLHRKSTGWFIMNANAIHRYHNRVRTKLKLTDAQKEWATHRMLEQASVL
jgi:hypothetical protein